MIRHPIPLVPPEVLAGRIQRRIMRPPSVNPHIGVLGPTRSGKDFAWRHLILGMAKPAARAIALDVKPGHDRSDCDVADCAGLGDQSLCGWGADVGPGAELAELAAHLGARRYRVLVPPGEAGRPIVQSTLAYADAVRELVLIMSDTGRITEHANRGGYGLGGPVTRLMSEGASGGLSVIACSTSAAWAESGVKDQTAAVLVGQITNTKMRAMFAELAGLPKYGRAALDSLKPRQFLYADYTDGEPALAITQARPVPGA